MASITETTTKKGLQFNNRINWNYFLQDNLTGSWLLTAMVVFLTGLTALTLFLTLGSRPTLTWAVTAIWAIGVLSVVIGELFSVNLYINDWLKKNLFTSVLNTLLTLFLTLLVGSVFAGIWNWGVTTATWSTARTASELRSEGATWGVIWGARELLAIGRFPRDQAWRVWVSGGLVLAMWLLTIVVTRPNVLERLSTVRRAVNIGWLLLPVAAYILLAGIDSSGDFISPSKLVTGTIVVVALMALLWWFKVIKLSSFSIALWVVAWPVAYVIWRTIGSLDIFTPINPDDLGGMLLTIIFAVFVTLASFPIGILLALGRRADVYGIPGWIIAPIAIGATLYFLSSSTPELWATSRNGIEQLLALWPLLIILAAIGLQYIYKGNVVQAGSVLTIEIVRGVPLITLLFMSIVMAPFFLPEGTQVRNVAAVLVGYTIFSAAYMAELVRGGLQAIPKGQYEAADSLGFNALQKYRFIVLPQALRILIPALAGSVIGTFKSSSLVSVIGMFDFVGIARAVFSNDQWLGLKTELYVFMFIVYFVVSAAISWYSRRIEVRIGLGQH